MTAQQFDFELLMTQYDREGFYYTDWSKGVRITVRAATQQQAINQAAVALGPCRRDHFGWTARVKSVTDARIADERAEVTS